MCRFWISPNEASKKLPLKRKLYQKYKIMNKGLAFKEKHDVGRALIRALDFSLDMGFVSESLIIDYLTDRRKFSESQLKDWIKSQKQTFMTLEEALKKGKWKHGEKQSWKHWANKL